MSHGKQPLMLCLCSKCIKQTHPSNGTDQPGLLLPRGTCRIHRTTDQRACVLASLNSDFRPLAANNEAREEDHAMEFDNRGDERHNQIRQEPTTNPIADDQMDMDPNASSDIRTSQISEDRPNDLTDNIYDTTNILAHNLSGDIPVVIHASLVASLMAVFDHSSLETASWLLRAQRDSMALTLSHGITGEISGLPVSNTTTLALRHMPSDIRTVHKWLGIDPHLIFFNCCSACFALYPIGSTPQLCVHLSDRVPGFVEDHDQSSTHTNSFNEMNEGSSAPRMCSQPLLLSNGKPVRRFAFQDLEDWIARFICRPSIEEDLDKSLTESRKPFSGTSPIGDIHQSQKWKEFKGPNGAQYTAQTGNLTFAMFMDGIQPLGKKPGGRSASITFIVLVCLTLPINLRYRPENVFLFGIAPGPKSPSLEQSNWVMGPLITQLNTLWHQGMWLSRTPCYPRGRLIRAAVLPFIADLPAIRGALGMAHHSATEFCSLCHISIHEINNIDPSSWIPRTSAEHRAHAISARDAETAKERRKIFEASGVRYSVMVELDYWKVTDYHVIDSMHNILLGLLSWHLTRFWAMSEEVENEPPPSPMTTNQIRQLVATSTARIRTRERYQHPQNVDRGVPLAEAQLPSDTSSGDDSFDPLGHMFYGWDGSYDHPLRHTVVFDSAILHKVNSRIRRIHSPSSLQRILPTLGQKGSATLKADELRLLFTVQLPLILIPEWTGEDQTNGALLHNFGHLVCLTNLALKRTMTSERISRLREQLQLYLRSSLKLFENCTLAPNHHMVLHLPDILAKFGPVRAWWAFPFERLMGQILKACHNNHLGELEITFLASFCRAGNLSALLNDEPKIPATLKPFIQQLKDIFDPVDFEPESINQSKSQPLEEAVARELLTRLNAFRAEGCVWLASDEWSSLSKELAVDFAPVATHGIFETGIFHDGVLYTTVDRNPDNSVIHVVSRLNGATLFGRIVSIFRHERFPTGGRPAISDTWLMVRYFAPVPDEKLNPFKKIDLPDMQVHLRLEVSSTPRLTHISEIVAQCAWLVYEPMEIHFLLNMKSIAMVSIDR